MFLSHFSGESFYTILERPIREVYFWYNEAVKVHNYLNTPKEKD